MKQINIKATPNQEFTVNINSYRYDFRFILIDDGVMAYDLSINELPVIQGFRIIKGALLLPYNYQEQSGNLFMSAPDDEDVSYQQFGQSQFLYYLNADEAEQVRNAS